jgi:tripartite-type tricarboxylate transporter receptor subunit TctC
MRKLAGLALAFCALVGVSDARAANYPTRPVHVIVGYPAGGSTDICARIFG